MSPTMFSAVQLILLSWSVEDRLNSCSLEVWPDVDVCVRKEQPHKQKQLLSRRQCLQRLIVMLRGPRATLSKNRLLNQSGPR